MGSLKYKIIAAILSVGLGSVLCSGCRNMSEADYAALGVRGYGMNAETSEQAQAAGLVSGLLSEAGRREHEIRREQVEKDTIIIINQAPAQKPRGMTTEELEEIVYGSKMTTEELEEIVYGSKNPNNQDQNDLENNN